MYKKWKVSIVVLALWIHPQPLFLCRIVTKSITSTLCGDQLLAQWVKETILGHHYYGAMKLTGWKMILKESPDLTLALMSLLPTVDVWIKLPYLNSLSFPILICVLDHSCFFLLSPLFCPWYCLVGFNKILKAAELAMCILMGGKEHQKKGFKYSLIIHCRLIKAFVQRVSSKCRWDAGRRIAACLPETPEAHLGSLQSVLTKNIRV